MSNAVLSEACSSSSSSCSAVVVERKKAQPFPEGAQVLKGRKAVIEDERGTAPGSMIVGKALEKMLAGTLNSGTGLDQAVEEGSALYKAATHSKKGKGKMGAHLRWGKITKQLEGSLSLKGEPISEGSYLRTLQALQERASGEPIGGMIIAGEGYFGVSIKSDGVSIFDPHGEEGVALMITTDSLEKGAEALDLRGRGDGDSELICFPFEAARVVELEDPIAEVVEAAPTAAKEGYAPIVTGSNYGVVASLALELEGAEGKSKEEIHAILARYEEVKIPSLLKESGNATAIALVLKGELHYFPVLELGVPSGSDTEEDAFYGFEDDLPVEWEDTGFEAKRELAARATEVGTLFIRDHVLPATFQKDVVDQRVIVQHVEEWFQSFLPTLFFAEGGEDQKINLALTTEVIGSLTTFLSDYNEAKKAVTGSGWFRSGKSYPAAELNQRISTHLSEGKESERVVLERFSGHLVELFEAQHGKPMGEDLKERIAASTAQVLDALIDTVLSPEFAKMLVLGFIDDDQIGGELESLESIGRGETVPGEVPAALKEELTKCINELIDFGNPRYSGWIATSMLKTHFEQVDNPGMMKSTLRFGMRLLSQSTFKDEISVFLENAFALQKNPEAGSEAWVKTATVGVRAVRRYGWNSGGRSLLGRVEEKRDIHTALHHKITVLFPEEEGTASWKSSIAHTFGKSLFGNLYDLTQSRPVMRTYTIRYLIGGVLTTEVRRQCAALPLAITPPLTPLASRDRSVEKGQQMSLLMGRYLRGYVGELYLKDTPLVTSVVDLSVTMVEGFLPEMVGQPQQVAFSKTKQELIVDVYGAMGPFLRDYALAIQEAKKEPTYALLAEQGKGEKLLLASLERVRGTPLKISDRDITEKLEALTDLMVRSHCSGVSPAQAQLVRSTAFVVPKVLKGAMDLVFSPEMMSALLVSYIQEFQKTAPVEDPHHQYQSWDAEVLVRWNDSLFDLMKGVAQLGEPEGKMGELVQSVLGLGDGAQKNLGPILARFSSGPSPFLSPAAGLQGIATLQRVLFDQEGRPKMTNIFNDSDRRGRDGALQGALRGLMSDPLPLESIRGVTEGWLGETVHGVVEFGQSAATHLGTLSAIVGDQKIVSAEGPLVRALKQEAQQRTSSVLRFLSPTGERALSGGLQGLLQEKLSEALEFKEFASGNPVMRYLDTTCSNAADFFNSPALMRAFVYNYVLTPQFFNHLVEHLDEGSSLSESSLAEHLPSSLFLDMFSLSWIVPGEERGARLGEAPKVASGMHFSPPAAASDFVGCQVAISRELQESERLFAGAEASPFLSALYEKLFSWEKEGLVSPEFTRGCLNNLEDIPAFIAHVNQWIEGTDVLSPDEKKALQEICVKGEFPFAFRYIDLMLSEESPFQAALLGGTAKEEIKALFLSEAVTGLNGKTVHAVEKMQLAKSFEGWADRALLRNEDGQRQMGVILDGLRGEEGDLTQKLGSLVGKMGEHLKLEGVDALFFAEVQRQFNESADPLRGAMQLFAIERSVSFWDEKTESIHETLGELRLAAPAAEVLMVEMEPAIKGYYGNLGGLLSDMLTEPFSDKLKLAVSESFLSRYRSLSNQVAPKEGERVPNTCSGAITGSSQGGNQHKLHLLRNAQKSIVMSGCYFGGDIFEEALAILRDQLHAKKGLDVKLIGSEYWLNSANRKTIKKLEEAYPDRFFTLITPEVQLYTSPISERTSYRTQHSKALVIDYGKYFEMGGSGLIDPFNGTGDTPMPSAEGRVTRPLAFRDADFVFRSEETHGMGYSLYLELLSLFPVWGAHDVKERIKASFDPRFNHVAVPHCPSASADNIDSHGGRRGIQQATFYSAGPDSAENQMLQDLIEDIEGAQSSLHIQHMYFHPVPELLSAMKEAAGRGVSIHLCTNRGGGDMPLTHELFAELSRANWKALLDGKPNPKLHLYEFGVANTTYHKKIIMVDGKKVYLGSTNLGEKSLRMNDHEINLRLESVELCKVISQCFLQDIEPKTRMEWRGAGRRRHQVRVTVKEALCPEVPQGKVLRTEIDKAVIAEIQASVLNRLL